MAVPLENTDLSVIKECVMETTRFRVQSFVNSKNNCHSERLQVDLPVRISIYYAADLDLYTTDLRILSTHQK